MTWFITHKPAYDADFVELPKSLQKQATQAHAELEQDPVTPRGNTIKPLKGWENLWRYRLGDHRLIYSALPENQVVQLLAIGPRGDVYRRFDLTNGYSPLFVKSYPHPSNQLPSPRISPKKPVKPHKPRDLEPLNIKIPPAMQQ